MAGRPLNKTEIAASAVVASVLGGQAAARDTDGAPERTHDFDVDLPSGRRIALEVTAAADGSIISQRAAAFGREWPAPRLTYNWWVSLRECQAVHANSITRLVRRVLPLLEQLERAEVGAIEARDRTVVAVPGQEALRSLGVAAAHRLGEPERDKAAAVFLSFRRGVSSDPLAINDLVTERAEAKRDKLLAARADERHLFVWIDNSHAGAELAMTTLPPPDPPPDVPDGIDVVWAATPGVESPVERLWRASPPGGWQVLRWPL